MSKVAIVKLVRKKKGTDEWHEEECFANHSGSAGKMEVDAVKEMFSWSEETFGVKYMNYIGDGDSKTYKAILELNPYDEDFPVVKSECVDYVEKRMGTRLRNLKKKKEKLGGKGKFTDVLIKKLTTYYGLAIRRNVESVTEMKKAIMGTLNHLCSTNTNPKHENCPPGEDSWCKTRAYESFNSTIWRLAPKHLNSGIKIMEIVAFIVAGIFNEEYSSILRIENNEFARNKHWTAL